MCTGMGCFLSFFSVREAAGTWSLVVAPLGHLVGAPIRGCRTQGCCGMVCLKSGSQWAVFFFSVDVMVAPKFGLSLILFLFLMRFFFCGEKAPVEWPRYWSREGIACLHCETANREKNRSILVLCGEMSS